MSLFKKLLVHTNKLTILDARIESHSNIQKAIKILEAIAETKNAEAALILGGAYAYGSLFNEYGSIKVDRKSAEKWFLKAMEYGDLNAEQELWQFYHSVGDVKKMQLHLQSCAKNGILNSMRVLGLGYVRGIFMLPQNFEKGIFWLRSAAKLSDSSSQKELGDIFSEGKVVEKDYFKAYIWYSLAALGKQKEEYEYYKRAVDGWVEPSDKHVANALRPKLPKENDAEKARNEIVSYLSRDEILKAQSVVEKCLSRGIETVDSII